MNKGSRRICQALAVIIELTVIAPGLSSLLVENSLFYSNWRGALVFAPITVIAGAFFLYLVVFKGEKSIDTPKSKRKG
jgi:hypothetical protein